jgi:signal transduction histidine kinase
LSGRGPGLSTSPPPARADDDLARIVAGLPIGVIIVGKERFEIVYANSAAQRLVHPASLRRGRPLPDVWRTFSLRDYAESLFNGGPVRDEEVRPDENHTFMVSGMTNQDQETAAILIEDGSAKARRRRAEREFVANAAHELLTPLTGIVGAAHVLQAGAKEVPEDRDRFINHIARECDRLAKISRALLVLARAQSGEHSPRLEPVLLCDLLDEIVATATAETAAATVVECSDDITVFVDRDLFVQALVNLVLNAAKHGAGRVKVSATRPEPGRVAIEVLDETARVTADQVERMGTRFYTGRELESEGFGLGLSIARQSIEALGGAITLGARKGEGLTARVEVLSGDASTP